MGSISVGMQYGQLVTIITSHHVIFDIQSGINKKPDQSITVQWADKLSSYNPVLRH